VLGGAHFNECARGGGKWDWRTILFQTFNVKLDRFTNQDPNFVLRLGGSNAAREIRNIGSKTRVTLLNDD